MQKSEGMRTMADGCRHHGISAEDVERRWGRISELVAGAVEGLDECEAQAEEAAQWSVVGMCHCCFGPCRDLVYALCSLCVGGDGCDACARVEHE